MKKLLILVLILFAGIYAIVAQNGSVTLKVYHTTDIHGNFFPFDFINNRDSKGGLARVSAYIGKQREKYGDHVLLLDGGDLLQGQPCVYYSNFVDVQSKHLGARILNYIGYDAVAVGNHDIETGHDVYDRWIKDCEPAVLGANILKEDGTPYLLPYRIFVRDGVKVAVIGMITEAIPAWLPENLWSGLHFASIEETARQLIPLIQKKEKPDIIIGLFHTGVESNELAGFKESVGMEVAQNVPGFDVILCGHDHSRFCRKIANVAGDSVLVIDPAAGANLISDITIQVRKKKGKVLQKSITGHLQNIAEIEPDVNYMNHFADDFRQTAEYVNAEIGEFTHSISAHNAFFGPSAFIDLLHSLQLKLTGADISLVAPLSTNAVIHSGKVHMRDMFNLYKYENLLYTMKLTGEEVKNALEYSSGLWCRQMTSAEDTLLLIRPYPYSDRYQFVNPFFVFDSAAGIHYTVDVSKPAGRRVTIAGLVNGLPFDKNKTYRVAVSSYQGSGGGGVLTEGAGIPREELNERIVFSTDKDLRYYLGEEIKKEKVVSPEPLNQWKFIPEDWVEKAAKREYRLLFGEK